MGGAKEPGSGSGSGAEEVGRMGWRVRLALLLCVALLWAAGLAAAGECGATAFLRHGGLGPIRPRSRGPAAGGRVGAAGWALTCGGAGSLWELVWELLRP